MRVVGKCDEGCDQRCPALKDPPCDHPCDADLLLSSEPGAITGGCCHTGQHSHHSHHNLSLKWPRSNVIISFDLAFLCGDWAHIDPAMWPMASGTHSVDKNSGKPPLPPHYLQGEKADAVLASGWLAKQVEPTRRPRTAAAAASAPPLSPLVSAPVPHTGAPPAPYLPLIMILHATTKGATA